MKRVAIKRYSRQHRVELKKRRVLKAKLIEEFGEHCMTCKDKDRDWREISLSHIIPVSRGGKTNKKNCILECYPCHETFEKHPELRSKNES